MINQAHNGKTEQKKKSMIRFTSRSDFQAKVAQKPSPAHIFHEKSLFLVFHLPFHRVISGLV